MRELDRKHGHRTPERKTGALDMLLMWRIQRHLPLDIMPTSATVKWVHDHMIVSQRVNNYFEPEYVGKTCNFKI